LTLCKHELDTGGYVVINDYNTNSLEIQGWPTVWNTFNNWKNIHNKIMKPCSHVFGNITQGLTCNASFFHHGGLVQVGSFENFKTKVMLYLALKPFNTRIPLYKPDLKRTRQSEATTSQSLIFIKVHVGCLKTFWC
jgi:hypothetical protein